MPQARSRLCQWGLHAWVAVGLRLHYEYEQIRRGLVKVHAFRPETCRRQLCRAERFRPIPMLDQYVTEVPDWDKVPVYRAGKAS
jgi:hypothetical protein